MKIQPGYEPYRNTITECHFNEKKKKKKEDEKKYRTKKDKCQ